RAALERPQRGISDFLDFHPFPAAGENSRTLKFAAKALAKAWVAVELFLHFGRLVEDWIPRAHRGHDEWLAQVELYDQRAAGDLRHAAAAHQRLRAVERFETGVGIVVAAEQRQPGGGPAARAQQHVEEFVLVFGEDSGRLGERDFHRAA